MGIKGIYGEIGPGQRIALAKLAVEAYELRDRPLRLAIDISIWLFQIQSGKGGTNPALRTFYYRLLRLISLGIHPLFVFDGPEKPPFKRNKRTGPNVASVPEFLAKQLLKQFGFPFHLARGEAEAECALLQRKCVVDAVLSEDVDTLMFGSGTTLRNWSPLATTKSKVPTHINLYDATKIKAESGLDRNGMILIALMSGGDYIPEGIPGCGIKTACDAARAGFGDSLCKIDRHDRAALVDWKTQLIHELRTNESKFFRQKHKSLAIPEEFPRSDVLGYYTHPVVSSDSNIERLKANLKWDQDIDIPALRSFCADAFDWVCISGAKHFARKLAPSLLVKELRLRAERMPPDDLGLAGQEELALVKSIYSKRESVTTDNLPELRISFVPLDLVKIDLDAEDPDPEVRTEALDSDGEGPTVEADDGAAIPESPRKARGPMTYNPTTMQKTWIPETFIKVGVPLKAQDWEESYRDARKYEAMKAVRKVREKAARKKKPTGGMPQGALTRFTQSSRPMAPVRDAVDEEVPEKSTQPAADNAVESVDLSEEPHLAGSQSASQPVSQSGGQPTRKRKPPAKARSKATTSRGASGEHSVPASQTAAQRSIIQSTFRVPPEVRSHPMTPRKKTQLSIVSLLSSPAQAAPPVVREDTLGPSGRDSTPQDDIMAAISNRLHQSDNDMLALPTSVSTRKKRSPLRRAETLPNPSTETAAIFDQSPMNSPPRKRLNSGGGCDDRTIERPKTPVADVIDLLSSSPPAAPQPRSGDKAVLTNVLERDPVTPSPVRRRRLLLAAAGQPVMPAKTLQRAALAAVDHNDGNQYIRLRESFNGAFAIESETLKSADGKAKKTTKADGQGKTWKMSAIQTMDLTTT